MAKSPKINTYKMKTFNTDEVLALAFAAHRLNSGYVKTTVRFFETEKPTIWSNKELISYTLSIESKKKGEKHDQWIPENFVKLETNDADVDNVDAAKLHVKKYLVGMMSNTLTTFQQEVHDLVISEEIPVTRIGLASYIPELIFKEASAINLKKKIKQDFADSVALTGDLSGTAEIISCVYVQRLETFSIMASVGSNLIKFFHKNALNTGDTIKFSARAKNSDIDIKTKCIVTYVNYLKIRKK